MRLLALGHTNQEIAKKLYISVRTAETHRAHIMQKLRLTTRAGLVRYALERGLLDEVRRGVADVAEVAGWVSPNPGGVGPMTRAMLLSNVVSIEGEEADRLLGPTEDQEEDPA